MAGVRFALETLEVSPHFRRALITQVAIFLKSFGDDLFQLGREVGIQTQWAQGRAVEDGVKDGGRGITAKWERSCSHFIEDRAKGEQVGTRVQLLALGLFRRHISHRANRGTRAGKELFAGDSATHGTDGAGSVGCDQG